MVVSREVEGRVSYTLHMSNRLVILALLLALLLGVVALVVLKTPRGGVESYGIVPVGERVVIFDPASITRITLQRPGEPQETLTRAKDGAQWTVRAGANGREWPLAPDRITGLIRLLQQARAIAEPVSGEANNLLSPNTLELFAGDTPVGRLETGTRYLAGQALARFALGDRASPFRAAMISDEIARVLQGSALSWRETALLTGVMRDATSVTLSSPQSGKPPLTLSRLRGRWRVMAPVLAPADINAAGRLLSTLESLRAVKFVDETDAAPTWLTQPQAIATIDLESRQSQGEQVASVTRQVTLKIGTIGDGAGKTVQATTDNGKTIVILDAEALAGLTLDPAKYIAAQAAQTPAADIGRLQISTENKSPAFDVTFKRAPDGWVELKGDGTEVLQDKPRAAELGEILALLTQTSATSIRLAAPEGYRRVGAIRLLSLSGDPLEELELGLAPLPGLIVHSPKTPAQSEVWRVYSASTSLLERVFGISPSPAAGNAPAPPATDQPSAPR